MATVSNVIEYPEEGLAIIEDDQGKYLAFRDTDEILPLEDYEDHETASGRRFPILGNTTNRGLIMT